MCVLLDIRSIRIPLCCYFSQSATVGRKQVAMGKNRGVDWAGLLIVDGQEPASRHRWSEGCRYSTTQPYVRGGATLDCQRR